jgi:hypothetical protein
MSGQFEDADGPLAAVAETAREGDTSSHPEEEGSDEECWELEYEDWHGETGDFTKKLNAARSGHHGANTQQGKGETGVSQKAIQVKHMTLLL